MPTTPPDVAFALAVNVEGIRPWEWWAWDSQEAHMLTTLRHAWTEGIAEEREAAARLAQQQP